MNVDNLYLTISGCIEEKLMQQGVSIEKLIEQENIPATVEWIGQYKEIKSRDLELAIQVGNVKIADKIKKLIETIIQNIITVRDKSNTIIDFNQEYNAFSHDTNILNFSIN